MKTVFGVGSEKFFPFVLSPPEEKNSLAETGAIEGRKISAEDISLCSDLK